MSSRGSRGPAKYVSAIFEGKDTKAFTYKPVDNGKHQDGVVLSKILIRNNGAYPEALATCV